MAIKVSQISDMMQQRWKGERASAVPGSAAGASTLQGADPGPSALLLPTLDEGYYLDNFWQMLDAATALYDDLFTPGERSFVDDFAALSLSAQRLYVRLLSRRGDCFRRDRMAYEEIPDLDQALDLLCCRGFARRADAVALPLRLGRLVRPELVALAAQCGGSSRGLSAMRKDELIQHLCASVEEALLCDWMAANVPMVQLLRWEETLSFRLYTFGSLSYDLTDFVLQELGVVVYETYPITRTHRVFPDRLAVEQALMLSQLRDHISVLSDAGAMEEAIALAMPLLDYEHPWAPTSRRYLDRIFNRIGRELERRKQYEEALSMLALASAPPARERRARILLELGRFDEAQALCQAMSAEPRDETEAPVAMRITEKLRRQCGEVVPRRKRSRRHLHLDMALVRSSATSNVEVEVLEALAAKGQPGFYAENGLWLGLFGLACWDIIFAPIPGAFQHPFQRAPLDLHDDAFRARREALFVSRLAALRAPGWQSLLLDTFRQKQGIANAFVDWSGISMALLEVVLSVLPGAHLAAICDRLSRDIRRYRRGFPDLFVFIPDAIGDIVSYQLIEVKGPGDQLRPEQSAWLDIFAHAGIPAAIARVTWVEEASLPAQASLFEL